MPQRSAVRLCLTVQFEYESFARLSLAKFFSQGNSVSQRLTALGGGKAANIGFDPILFLL